MTGERVHITIYVNQLKDNMQKRKRKKRRTGNSKKSTAQGIICRRLQAV
jgi:hypothetical protein